MVDSRLAHDGTSFSAFLKAREIRTKKPAAPELSPVANRTLCGQPVLLYEHGRLAGMLHQTGNSAREVPEYIRQLRAAGAPFIASPGHITWRWDRVLKFGISGLIEQWTRRAERAASPEESAYCRSAIDAWEQVLTWNDLHRKEMRRRLAESSGEQREFLAGMVRLMEKVPRRPAETFHEALQSFYFSYLAVMFENPYGGNGPGRMDYFLWPYLERDLAAGRITMREAGFLIDELFLHFEERLHGSDGWVETIMAGGTAPDGTNSVNPLSFLLVESILKWNQTHPAVYMRLRPDDPPEFRQLAVRYLREGNNRAQLYNDPICLRALGRNGIAPEDAAHYTAGGCMEPGIQGGSSDLNFAFHWNVALSLERWLKQVSPKQFVSFDALLAALETALESELGELVRGADMTAEAMGKFRPTPLLSTLIDDCIERCRDQQRGGARYPDYGFAPLGITSAADSLFAVKCLVYQEHSLDWNELEAALAADFVGFEPLRTRLLAVPKYGSGDRRADEFCNEVMSIICRISARQRTAAGGRVRPMIFNFVWTPEASGQLGARPDGSRAGEYIGHGMTPRSAAMTEGLTTAVNSCLRLNFEPVSGFATTMWDLDESSATETVISALVGVFLSGDCMVMQGNTTSLKQMEEALKDPGRHPSLIVRVGGFSARFSSLSRELQEEIVRRRRLRTA